MIVIMVIDPRVASMFRIDRMMLTQMGVPVGRSLWRYGIDGKMASGILCQ